MKILGQEPEACLGGPSCCGLSTPPRAYRYVLFVLIVIVIVLQLRYGITIPLPGIVITGGAGYAVTLRAPAFRPARARLA